MGLGQATQVGVEEAGTLGGRRADDVSRVGDTGEDVEARDPGGPGPDVVGVEPVADRQGPGTTGPLEGTGVDTGEGLAPGQGLLARGVDNGGHEAAVAQGKAPLGGQGRIEVGGHVQSPGIDGVDALGQQRPVDRRVPALDDGHGPVLRTAGHLEALVEEGLADAIAADDEHHGARFDVLGEHGGRVHGGAEDLRSLGEDVVVRQFVHDRLGRA